MKWNVTSVEKNLETLTIIGFCSDKTNLVMTCKIIKTTLKEEFDSFTKDYNEGNALSIVNPNLVYKIDILFETDKIMYDILKNNPYISADETKFFDDDYYMGLPTIVFIQWRTMINIDL